MDADTAGFSRAEEARFLFRVDTIFYRARTGQKLFSCYSTSVRRHEARQGGYGFHARYELSLAGSDRETAIG